MLSVRPELALRSADPLYISDVSLPAGDPHKKGINRRATPLGPSTHHNRSGQFGRYEASTYVDACAACRAQLLARRTKALKQPTPASLKANDSRNSRNVTW